MSADENRQRFPEWTKVVDEFRLVFGPDVKVKRVKENGRELVVREAKQ
jgi:hypothetical protein